ncbi:uncharacterized protein LOC126354546 isoform X1 [Schistocerca gregaria]|uniref:uncharacterized protein LOC126354546 isoform X1 n=1 Tax=Schistocerca gregaria TaxID=7010 RepID=UPI00211E5F9C|nr:uncharacterized protein LOC126354546 isoform X1 [Schistocerca gregaria]
MWHRRRNPHAVYADNRRGAGWLQLPMFRRLVGMFCLQCARNGKKEDVVYAMEIKDDADIVHAFEKEYQVLKLHLCSDLKEEEEDVPLCATEAQRALSPLPAEGVSAQRRPLLENTELEDQVVGTVGDATLILTVASVHAEPQSDCWSEEEGHACGSSLKLLPALPGREAGRQSERTTAHLPALPTI